MPPTASIVNWKDGRCLCARPRAPRCNLADPGFAADRVLTVRVALPSDDYPTAKRRSACFDALLSSAERLPGVTAATIGYGATPPSDFVAGAIDVGGRVVSSGEPVSFVTGRYFAVMGIPVMSGNTRDLDAPQPQDDRQTGAVPRRSIGGSPRACGDAAIPSARPSASPASMAPSPTASPPSWAT